MKAHFKILSTMNDLNLIVPKAFQRDSYRLGVTNIFATDKMFALHDNVRCKHRIINHTGLQVFIEFLGITKRTFNVLMYLYIRF